MLDGMQKVDPSLGLGRSWLGLGVIPSRLSSRFGSGLLSSRGRVWLVHAWFGPANSWLSPGSGLALGRVPGLGLAVDGLGAAGPGGELFPQLGDIRRPEPYLGKYPIVHLVQPQPRISEVLAGQTRVQAAGKADQLRRGVTLQRSSHISEVPRLDPASQRAHLPAHHVFQVQHRPDIHHHRLVVPAEVRQLQHHLRPTGSGHDPLGQLLPHPREQVIQPGHLVLSLGLKPACRRAISTAPAAPSTPCS